MGVTGADWSGGGAGRERARKLPGKVGRVLVTSTEIRFAALGVRALMPTRACVHCLLQCLAVVSVAVMTLQIHN